MTFTVYDRNKYLSRERRFGLRKQSPEKRASDPGKSVLRKHPQQSALETNYIYGERIRERNAVHF